MSSSPINKFVAGSSVLINNGSLYLIGGVTYSQNGTLQKISSIIEANIANSLDTPITNLNWTLTKTNGQLPFGISTTTHSYNRNNVTYHVILAPEPRVNLDSLAFKLSLSNIDQEKGTGENEKRSMEAIRKSSDGAYCGKGEGYKYSGLMSKMINKFKRSHFKRFDNYLLPYELSTLENSIPILPKKDENQFYSPPAMFGHSVCKMNDTALLIYGGQMIHSGMISSDVFIYNLDSRLFTPIKSINLGLTPQRAYHSAICLKNSMLVLGGIKPDGGLANLSTASSLAFSDFRWSEIPLKGKQIPSPREMFSTHMLDDSKIIISGGRGQEFIKDSEGSVPVKINTRYKFLGDVFTLDMSTWSWEQRIGANSNLLKGRYGHSVYLIDNHLFILGGVNSKSIISNSSNLKDTVNFEIVKTSSNTEWSLVSTLASIDKPSLFKKSLDISPQVSEVNLKSTSILIMAIVVTILLLIFLVGCILGISVWRSNKAAINTITRPEMVAFISKEDSRDPEPHLVSTSDPKSRASGHNELALCSNTTIERIKPTRVREVPHLINFPPPPGFSPNQSNSNFGPNIQFDLNMNRGTESANAKYANTPSSKGDELGYFEVDQIQFGQSSQQSSILDNKRNTKPLRINSGEILDDVSLYGTKLKKNPSGPSFRGDSKVDTTLSSLYRRYSQTTGPWKEKCLDDDLYLSKIQSHDAKECEEWGYEKGDFIISSTQKEHFGKDTTVSKVSCTN